MEITNASYYFVFFGIGFLGDLILFIKELMKLFCLIYRNELKIQFLKAK